jgi:hypothetical protein
MLTPGEEDRDEPDATKVMTAEIGFMAWHFLWVSDPGL